MHSLLKHLQGRGMLSAYDPRDFFSRDPHRVAKALRALFAVPNNNIRVFLAGKLIFSGAQQEQQHSKEPTSHYRHCSLDLARYLGSNHGMHTVRSTDSLVGHAGHTHSMSRAGSSLGRAGSSGCRMARASSYCGLAGLADRENRPRILGKERSTSFAQSGVPPPPAPSPHPKWMRGLEHQLMPFLAVAMASSESAAAAAASAAARVDMQQRVARARRAAAAAPMPPHAKQVPTAAAGSTGACPVAFGGRGTAAASGCAGASPSALGGAGGAGPAGAGSFGGGGHYGSGIGFAERETATPSSAPSSPEGFSKQHLQQQQQQQYAQPSTLSRSRTPPHPSKPRPSLAVPAQSATTTAVTSPPTPTIAPRSARVPTTDTAITTAREANNTLTADHAIPSLTSTCPPSIANSNITTAAGIAREGGSCNQPSTAADTLKESPTEARADLHQPMAIATAPPHTLTPPLPTEQRAAPSSSTPIHPGPSSYLPATGAGNGMSSSPVRAGLPSSPAAAKPQSPWPTTMLQPEGDRETSEEAAHAASPLTAAPPQQPPQQQQQPPILSAPAAPALRISTNPLSPPSPQHPALTPPSSTFAFFTLPAAPSTPPLTPSLATSPLNPSPFASAFTSTLLTAPNMAPPGTTTSLLPTASTPATPTAASDAAAAEPSQVPQALTGPTGDPAADSPLTPPLHASSAPALNTLTDSLSELPPVRRLGAVGNAVGKSTGFLSSLADSHDTKGVLGGRDSSIRALQVSAWVTAGWRWAGPRFLVHVFGGQRS
uniref:inositol-pentakisphosphate 2-kinase n=1 Tax=Dunaliella tertiolecta TaxID=3047 RepID=A0A7S3QSR8_DUNTE